MTLQKSHDPHAHAMSLWERGSLFALALLWFGAFGSTMLVAMTLTTLQQRWRRINAEVPLLALLPGLGNPRQAKLNLFTQH